MSFFEIVFYMATGMYMFIRLFILEIMFNMRALAPFSALPFVRFLRILWFEVRKF